MRLRSKSGIIILVILLATVICPRDIRAEDPLLDMWTLHQNSLHSMDVEMSAKIRLIRDWRDVKAAVDFDTGRVKARILHKMAASADADRVVEIELGRTSKASWRYTAQDDGAYRLYLRKLEQGDDRASTDAEIGLPNLREAYDPYHLQLRKIPGLSVSLEERRPSTEIAEAEHLSYVASDGSHAIKVNYEVKIQGGVRIYLARVEADGQLIETIENSDFQQDNGVWFPRRSKKTEYRFAQSDTKEKATAMTDASELQIRSIKINGTHDDSSFSPNVQIGDRVYDDVLDGLQYKYGELPQRVSELLDLPTTPTAPSAAKLTAKEKEPKGSSAESPRSSGDSDAGATRAAAYIVLGIVALVLGIIVSFRLLRFARKRA